MNAKRLTLLTGTKGHNDLPPLQKGFKLNPITGINDVYVLTNEQNLGVLLSNDNEDSIEQRLKTLFNIDPNAKLTLENLLTDNLSQVYSIIIYYKADSTDPNEATPHAILLSIENIADLTEKDCEGIFSQQQINAIRRTLVANVDFEA